MHDQRTRWTLVSITAGGRFAYGTFDTREAAEKRKVQIEGARRRNGFGLATELTIEPADEWKRNRA